MPHQCTNCDRTFPDGSKEMLSGCPDCGGNKFQFRPAGATAGDGPGATPDADPDPDANATANASRTSDPTADATADSSLEADSGGTSTPADSGAAEPADSAVEAGRDSGFQFGSDPESGDASGSSADVSEDRAQASARSDVVDVDELAASARDDAPAGADPPAASEDARVVDAPDDDRPDIEDLRAELNDQFESIRIVNPGEYELNLMELYDRQEYIISLQEDGRYVIEVPDTWSDDASLG